MIHYIKIKNFGPIKDEVELNFESEYSEDIYEDIYVSAFPDGTRLLKLAYIYGPNASGKTSILRVFEFLRQLFLTPIQNKSWSLDFEPFLFCKEPYREASSIELAFYVNQIRHIYTATFNHDAILTEKLSFFTSVKPTEIFSRVTDAEKRVVSIQFGSKIKVPAKERDRLESNTLHNNTVLGAFAKTNADIPELNALNLWLNQFFLGMISSSSDLIESTAELIVDDPKANKWLNSFMNKADRQISRVNAAKEKSTGSMIRQYGNHNQDYLTQGSFVKHTDIKPTGALVTPHVMYGGGDLFEYKRKIELTHHTKDGVFNLPLDAESSGTQRYFALGGPLYKLVHTSALLLVDELETSLHPDLMKHFLQSFLANSEQSQMLITTHNVLLMEEVDFIRKDALWFTEKKADGSVNLYSAADFDSSVIRKGASLINAYRAGRLGAKPNLGSPYIAQE